MWRCRVMRYSALFSSLVFSSLSWLVAHPAWSQSPNCAPPRANEYLLLVANQAADTQAQLQQLLPETAVITACRYLEDEVVRVEGFATSEVANAWAQYLSDMAGLQAFVARPASSTSGDQPTTTAAIPPPVQGTASGGTSSPVAEPIAQGATSFPTPTQLPSPSATPSPESPVQPSSSSYNPQPLGAGYAILVYYFNRPEVAADVQQVTQQPVGLVSYEQRPFLLATHTTDSATAASVLQALSDRGFTAVMVDGRRAILLTPAVVGTN